MKEFPPTARNLWDLTVLCLLRGRPMHPYEMDRCLREWHKAEFLDLKQSSLYHAIHRLQRAGLIEAVETTREGRRPERTVYRLTTLGEEEPQARLRALLAQPIHEPSLLMAALSYVAHLTPEDVARQVEGRLARLEAEVTELDRVIETLVPRLGRLLLLEVEYTRALRQAELEWLREFVGDLRAGRLTWDPDAIRQAVASGGRNRKEDVP